MKKKRIELFTVDHILLVVCILLCSISMVQAGVSIREQMQNKVTSLSTLQDFYITYFKPYERRYIIQYTPEYLEKFGVQEVPAWFVAALDSALDSPYDRLAISAINCIGQLNLSSFNEKLTKAFVAVSPKKTNYSAPLRMAILQSMHGFPVDNIQKTLPILLKGYPEQLIRDPVFEKLMELSIQFGDNRVATEIERFDVYTKNRAFLNKDKPDYREYQKIVDLVSKTKNAVAQKGGIHE
jgi:hypothetical protein